MSRLSPSLAALAAGGLLASGLLASGLPATASAPSRAVDYAVRDAPAVRTTTWSAAIHVEETSGFQLKLPRVPAGDYAATLSGAIVSGKDDLFCALVVPRTERTLLADISRVGSDGLHLVDAGRTIHLGATQDLSVVCSSGQQERYSSPPHFPMQVSLTRVDRLTEKTAKVLRPVKTGSLVPRWR